jgi:hypothetical protein
VNLATFAKQLGGTLPPGGLSQGGFWWKLQKSHFPYPSPSSLFSFPKGCLVESFCLLHLHIHLDQQFSFVWHKNVWLPNQPFTAKIKTIHIIIGYHGFIRIFLNIENEEGRIDVDIAKDFRLWEDNHKYLDKEEEWKGGLKVSKRML